MIKVSEARAELDELKDEDPDDRDEERYEELVMLFAALDAEDDAEFLYEDDREWQDYCREYADEWLAGVPDMLKDCIDWELWADNMLADKTVITVNGTDYILV